MIAIMASNAQQTLGEYIKEKLGERSIRALATYAGIGVGTASNLINDKTEKPDASTLQKVAEYLDVPVENLYRLAGYIEEEAISRTVLFSEIEHMLRELPEEAQRKIRDMIRVEWEYSRKPSDEDNRQERKAS
jgi:transcriptional regulator with XRE-family HTH domain